MEIRQLKYFIKTAELLNFSEAARVLFITQSTLSQQIKQLENELGTQLFERSSHGVVLTENGMELLPYAKKTLLAVGNCFERMRDLQNITAGTLSIGVTFTFSPILTETLLTFMARFPKVKLNIVYKTMEELMVLLEKREVDFVLAFKPTTVAYPRIHSHILFDNNLSVIVSKTHPMAGKQQISLPELQQYDLAMPSKGLQARNAFDVLVQGKLFDFKVKIELNEVNILLELVRNSGLATILSEASIYGKTDVSAVKIAIPDGSNVMEGCIHILKDSYQKSSAKEFVRLLCESESIKERAFNWMSSSFFA